MKKGQIALMSLVGIFFFIVFSLIGGLCWNYSIHTWANHFHKIVSIKFWQCVLIGFVPVLGQASIPVAALTWILMMFI